MKLQTLFSTTLLFALMLFISPQAAIAQSGHAQIRSAISTAPSEAELKKMDPVSEKAMRESIAILKKAEKIQDGNSAEAKRLYDQMVEAGNAVQLTPLQACVRACTNEYIACVAGCDSWNCRSACYYARNWCGVQCRLKARKGQLQETETPVNTVPGGKK